MEPTEEMIDELCIWLDLRGRDADRDRTRHLFRYVLEIVERTHSIARFCGDELTPQFRCALPFEHDGVHVAGSGPRVIWS